MNTWHFRMPRIIRGSKSSAFLSNESPYAPGSHHPLFKPIHHLTRTDYAERCSSLPLSPLCDHWVCISQHFHCAARSQLTIKGATTDASAVLYKHQKWLHKNKTVSSSSSTGVGLTNYFGQFLSSQWNPGEFSADSAEPSAQDPLCFFAVGRVVTVCDNGMKIQMNQSRLANSTWHHIELVSDLIAVLGISLYFKRVTRTEGRPKRPRSVTHLWSSLCRQRQQQNSSESRMINRKDTRLPAAITPIRWLGSERQHPGDSGCANVAFSTR